MHAAPRLPWIARAELEDVCAHLHPAIDRINAAPAKHRVGHVGVSCDSLLAGLDPHERATVLAYLQYRALAQLN